MLPGVPVGPGQQPPSPPPRFQHLQQRQVPNGFHNQRQHPSLPQPPPQLPIIPLPPSLGAYSDNMGPGRTSADLPRIQQLSDDEDDWCWPLLHSNSNSSGSRLQKSLFFVLSFISKFSLWENCCCPHKEVKHQIALHTLTNLRLGGIAYCFKARSPLKPVDKFEVYPMYYIFNTVTVFYSYKKILASSNLTCILCYSILSN